MGLDQYIFEVTDLECYKKHAKSGIEADFDEEDSGQCIGEEVLYFRKCYPIQQYFDEVYSDIGGIYNCKYYLITQDILDQLITDCEACLELLEPYCEGAEADYCKQKDIPRDVREAIGNRFDLETIEKGFGYDSFYYDIQKAYPELINMSNYMSNGVANYCYWSWE